MEIRQISQQPEIRGMVTFRGKVWFFTADGLYYIDTPEPNPWYKRVWKVWKGWVGL